MGVTSFRSGSHPVILPAVTDRSVQVTVIVVDYLVRGDPFLLVLASFPASLAGCRSISLCNKNLIFIGINLAVASSAERGRECWHLRGSYFRLPVFVQTFYRSPEFQIYIKREGDSKLFDLQIHTTYTQKLFTIC